MKKLTITPRRWLLSSHIIFSIALVGHVMIDLLLALVANGTSSGEVLKACYISIHYIDYLDPISGIGTIITGIILCTFTQWGVFKYYWIVAKIIMTIIVGVIGAIDIQAWAESLRLIASSEGVRAVQNSLFKINNQRLIAGLIFEMLMLSAVVVISIFKPWGLIKKQDSHAKK